MTKNKDLKPQDRKLPKGWKKPKWTAPEDPYDPLKNLFKKKWKMTNFNIITFNHINSLAEILSRQILAK